MAFSSPLFIFAFCPLFFIIYYFAPMKYKNAAILTGSLFFYAWGTHSFILVVLTTCLIDYKLGAAINKLRQAPSFGGGGGGGVSRLYFSGSFYKFRITNLFQVY
jgi:alginate O-acetyltransferase complex protein AlgI